MPNDEHPATPRVNAAARAALERVLDHLYCDEETSALAAKRTGDSGYEGEANAFGAAYTLLKEALATFEDTGDAEASDA